MWWTAITQQKASIFKGTQSVAWSVCELALTRALTRPYTQQRERGRLQEEVVKNTSMGSGENLGMTESVSPDMYIRCQKSLWGKPALNHLCSILSPTSLFLLQSLSHGKSPGLRIDWCLSAARVRGLRNQHTVGNAAALPKWVLWFWRTRELQSGRTEGVPSAHQQMRSHTLKDCKIIKEASLSPTKAY